MGKNKNVIPEWVNELARECIHESGESFDLVLFKKKIEEKLARKEVSNAMKTLNKSIESAKSRMNGGIKNMDDYFVSVNKLIENSPNEKISNIIKELYSDPKSFLKSEKEEEEINESLDFVNKFGFTKIINTSDDDVLYNSIAQQIQFTIRQLNSFYVNNGLLKENQTVDFIKTTNGWRFTHPLEVTY